jgi:hypothetical protein
MADDWQSDRGSLLLSTANAVLRAVVKARATENTLLRAGLDAAREQLG